MRTKILSSCSLVVCAALCVWANQPPRAQTVVVFTEPGKPVEVELVADDPDGDQLTFELLDSARFGKVLGSPPRFIYYPDRGFEGAERLSFRVVDRYGAFDIGFVEIRVTRAATGLKVVPKPPELKSTQLVDFLLQQGVEIWYVVDLEPRTFFPGVLPFIFAAPYAEARVFVVGPMEAPEIRGAMAGQGYVFAADLRQARPGTYFFLAISANQAFSYPFRIALPEPNRILAQAGQM